MSFLSNLEVGSLIDFYRIDALVVQSGMSSIYRATDTRNNRQVALKIPLPEMEADPILHSRFQREASIGERLQHPGILKIYGGEPHSRIYMVMEWCEGHLLRKILSEGHLLHEKALRITSNILCSLEYIHANGIVHRDLKPENIMVDDRDSTKIIDFGIASDTAARRLTYTKFTPMLGTPDYIAPEQVKGQRGDARTDIYAVGVMLYEMLSGKLPFSGPSPLAVMNDRLINHPTPPRVADPSISPQLQEVIYRALEKDPRNRYSNAGSFLWDLTHLDQVGVEDRPELRDWRKRRAPLLRKIIFYLGLALIPLALLLIMVLLAHYRVF